MGCGGGECDYVGGGVAEGEEGEVGTLGYVWDTYGWEGKIGVGIWYMCFVYMGREFVFDWVGWMFLLGALNGAFGISERIEVTLAFSVITKRSLDIPPVCLYLSVMHAGQPTQYVQ